MQKQMAVTDLSFERHQRGNGPCMCSTVTSVQRGDCFILAVAIEDSSFTYNTQRCLYQRILMWWSNQQKSKNLIWINCADDVASVPVLADSVYDVCIDKPVRSHSYVRIASCPGLLMFFNIHNNNWEGLVDFHDVMDMVCIDAHWYALILKTSQQNLCTRMYTTAI